VEITLFTYAFLPLLLATRFKLDRLLLLIVLSSVFDAASVLNINLGSFAFGLQPAFAATIIFIAIVMARWLAGQLFGNEGRVLYVFWPFILFSAVAVLSAVLLPHLFAGEVFVWPQRKEPGMPDLAVPLYPNSGNITQAAYLSTTMLLAITACAHMESKPRLPQRVLDVYFASGVLACAIALWQWGGKIVGLYFPHDFFFSNPSWADNTDQTFLNDAVPRIAGTFAEPSFLCFYLSGLIYASGWRLVVAPPAFLPAAAFVGSVAVAALSTSTTGYVSIAVGIPLLLLFTARTPLVIPRLGLAAAVAPPVLLVVGFLVWRYLPDLVEIGNQILTDTLNKGSTESYEVRTRQDHDSYALLLDTFGLGAGWGSVRASSFLATFIGATGIWGPLLLVWLVLRVGRSWKRARRLAGPNSTLEPFAASVVGMLVAAATSKPDLVFTGFWINLAAAVAISLQLRQRADTEAVILEGANVTVAAPASRGMIR